METLEPRSEWLEPRMECLEPRMECLEPRMECLESRMECLEPRIEPLIPGFEPPRIVLSPGTIAEGYEPIVIETSGDKEVRVIAEWLGVVG